MERIQSINPQRIEWCCTDHGITPSMLAAEVGIKPERMDKLMAGEDGIVFNQLDSIAKYFGRGALFFLEPTPVDEARLRTTAFRTLANQKPELSGKLKTLIERTERQREIYLSLLEDLDPSQRPTFAPPALPTNNARDAAKLARTWLGLGEENNFDDYRAAVEAKGILVFRSNGYTGKWQIAKENPILGFALYDETCPVIVVKKQASNTQQSFTLMHELGHFLLHKMLEMQRIIEAPNSDLFDVLAYVAYALEPLTRKSRADRAMAGVSAHFNAKHQVFLDFVLAHYVELGVDELDVENLSGLLALKYQGSMKDALDDLGAPQEINRSFSGFQKHLYA